MKITTDFEALLVAGQLANTAPTTRQWRLAEDIRLFYRTRVTADQAKLADSVIDWAAVEKRQEEE